MNKICRAGQQQSKLRECGRRLLIQVTNLGDILRAYGSADVRHSLFAELQCRLIGHLGLVRSDICVASDHIVTAVGAAEWIAGVSDDLFLEGVKAALCELPIQCAEHLVVVSILATFDVPPFLRTIVPGCQDRPEPTAEIARDSLGTLSKEQIAYRRDMAAAVRFIEQLRNGRLLLAFQPVVAAGEDQANIYSETLLRRVVDRNGDIETCQEDILALERLGLIDRLDRSVIWAVIQVLEDYPTIRLGGNVSARSLRHDGWWRLIERYLDDHPDVSRRLTIEVTETSEVTQSIEAVNLLHTLRVLGCRIAIDDMGSGYSTLDFSLRVRPDIIKIGRAFVARSSGEGGHPDLLGNLVALYGQVGGCVVVEGVELEAELKAVIDAGAHGIQGYLIERPTASPRWLKSKVMVRDGLSLEHRCFIPLPV